MYKPRAVLDEMPLLVKEKIVENLEWRDRRKLRQCSPTLQQAVDSSAVHFDRLFICLCKYSVDVFYQQISQSPNRCTQTVYTKSSPTFRNLSDSEFLDKVVSDLTVLLRNRKLTIDQFVVSFGMPEYGVISNFKHLKSRFFRYFYTRKSSKIDYSLLFEKLAAKLQPYLENSKLKVENYTVYLSEPNKDFIYWLQFLDPLVLRSVQIESVKNSQKKRMSVQEEAKNVLDEQLLQKLLDFPAWSYLERVAILDFQIQLAISDFWSFETFEATLTEISTRQVVRLVQKLTRSEHKVKFDITTPNLSNSQILLILGRTFFHDHKGWRKYQMRMLGASLIFQTLGGHRFVISVEDCEPDVHDFDILQ